MRLFIAINFDAPTTRRLARLRETARDYCPGANFSPDGNLHLTLAFLGEVAPARTAEIARAMQSVRCAPIDVEFRGTEAFGGGLLCVGVTHSPALMRMQAALAEALAEAGFTPDARTYRPHVTLARRFEAQGWSPAFAPFRTTAREICLMKSEQIWGKVNYTEIFRQTLS